MTAPPSALPSPTSPRATTRIRIKDARIPSSSSNGPSTERHGERMRSMSPPLSRIATADPDTSSTQNRTTPLASAGPVTANKRRQPSIAYYTPLSPSPFAQRPQSHRTTSSGMDGPHDGEPIMTNGKENVSQRSSLVLSSRTPSTRESVSSADGMGATEREPLTLVEKHADLLHFIAQKERKCLELRDQLAANEKELAELKCKWERIVNPGHDHLSNPPHTAGLGGVTLDGLKEGVRMIAAGFSDFGGATQELDSGDKHTSKLKSLTHASHENNNVSDAARPKRMGSIHLSTSSCSSIQGSMHSSDHVLEGGEGETLATASSLSRAGSLNYRMHKRASRVITNEPTTPTNPFVPPPAQNSNPANLDVGLSFILTPSPTLMRPLSLVESAVPASRPAPKSPVLESARPLSAGPMSTWMDSMGWKLSGLPKNKTISKNQKRASLLLAGVSNTITSALLPGPTATTPAPIPISTSTSRVLSSPSTSPLSTESSVTTLLSSPQPRCRPHPQFESHPHPSYKTMTDWLDDEDEEEMRQQTVRLMPDLKPQLHIKRGEVAATATATATAVSSFDDDDWNW